MFQERTGIAGKTGRRCWVGVVGGGQGMLIGTPEAGWMEEGEDGKDAQIRRPLKH